MSRIQRLGIGNGGVDCQISYMQAKKYPNAGDIVKPVQGVSNRNLLKNPYNTLNEPIAHPGQRPLMITTDNRGNVFARSETNLIPGITNDTLLKNPNNIRSVAVGEKRTLSLQRIKDINNKMLPNYITENKGINEVMLQIVTMIENKQVKLITIQLLKILITKQIPVKTAHTEQKVLQALNYLDLVLTEGRRIFKENTLSPTNIPTALRPAVTVYVDNIIKLYNLNNKVDPPNIDREIQTGLAELGLLSNALTRMFEYNNSINPSNTLSRDQINGAAFASPFQAPPEEKEMPSGAPPAGAQDQQEVQDDADPEPQLVAPVPYPKPLNMSNLFNKETIDKYKASMRVIQRGRIYIPLIKNNIFESLFLLADTVDESEKQNTLDQLESFFTENKDELNNEYIKFANELPSHRNLLSYLEAIRNFFFQPVQAGRGRLKKHRLVKYRKY